MTKMEEGHTDVFGTATVAVRMTGDRRRFYKKIWAACLEQDVPLKMIKRHTIWDVEVKMATNTAAVWRGWCGILGNLRACIWQCIVIGNVRPWHVKVEERRWYSSWSINSTDRSTSGWYTQLLKLYCAICKVVHQTGHQLSLQISWRKAICKNYLHVTEHVTIILRCWCHQWKKKSFCMYTVQSLSYILNYLEWSTSGEILTCAVCTWEYY